MGDKPVLQTDLLKMHRYARPSRFLHTYGELAAEGRVLTEFPSGTLAVIE